VQVHQIRKLDELATLGPASPAWTKLMAGKRRKPLFMMGSALRHSRHKSLESLAYRKCPQGSAGGCAEKDLLAGTSPCSPPGSRCVCSRCTHSGCLPRCSPECGTALGLPAVLSA
jgi:hypothetical protein